MKARTIDLEALLFCSAEDESAAEGAGGEVNTDITSEDDAAPESGAASDDGEVNTDLTADEGSDSSAEEADDSDINPLLGAPEGDYEDFEIPEGLAAPEPQAMDEFRALAKEIGLSQEGAQKVLSMYTDRERAAIQATERMLSEANREWRTELQNDPEIGGTELRKAVGLAKAGFDAVPNDVGKRFLADMKVAGLGSLPSVVKLGVYLGRIHGESDVLHRGNAAPAGERASLAERMFPDMDRVLSRPGSTRGASE